MELPVRKISIQQADQAAKAHIAENAFNDARAGLSANTARNLKDSAVSWCEFMAAINTQFDDLDCVADPAAWAGVTANLLRMYQKWLIGAGYAINTINRRVSAVRWYCERAADVGLISKEERGEIQSVKLLSHKEGINLDSKRSVNRVGRKKAKNTILTEYHVARLKTVKDERDRLVFCLMLCQAMRVSEVVTLRVEDFNLADGIVNFWRHKTKEFTLQRLEQSTILALGDYLARGDAPKAGILIRGMNRNRALTDKGITPSALDLVIKRYGAELGLPSLSAHDFRHSAATRAAKAGTPLKSLMGLGNWKSAATAERYIDDLTITNEGVRGLE